MYVLFLSLNQNIQCMYGISIKTTSVCMGFLSKQPVYVWDFYQNNQCMYGISLTEGYEHFILHLLSNYLTYFVYLRTFFSSYDRSLKYITKTTFCLK